MEPNTQDTYKKILAVLQGRERSFRMVEHEPEGRTEVISRIRGNSLSQAAKAMLLRINRGKSERLHYLVVVPGDYRVDLRAVMQHAGGTHVMFARPEQVRELTGCEIGAVPPFSFHDNLTLFVDPGLLQLPEIVFNAGRLDRSIFLRTEVYREIAKPQVVSVALPNL